MRILVVEDDRKLAAVIEQGLKEAGFAVDAAEDGSKAGARPRDGVRRDRPGCHASLPKRFRRRERAPGPPQSGAGPDPERAVRGRRADQGARPGRQRLPCKAVCFQELLARLRAITRRPAVEPISILSAADLRLDTTRREVTRAGRKIDLTAKEFALLEYLLRRKGFVVTRGMILDHVWSLDYDGGSNIVEVYINYLRRDVDQNFEPKLIHTIRGAGYVLRETG